MDKVSHSFNDLEFNLYELLNLPIGCSTEDVKKTFRRLIKKFHPDKITSIEEKLYYNITIANHILSNQESKDSYDKWLIKSNMNHESLKNNFKNDLLDVKQYFPQTIKEAQVEFIKNNDFLKNRHGEYKEDSRSISSIYKEKEINRKDLPSITQENFSNMKDFNKKFSERKGNGVYNNQIVKRDADIIPYEGKNNNFAEIKDFNNVYIKDTQLNYAFSLMHVKDEIDYGESNVQKIDNYNNNTRSINNKISLDDIGI